LFTVIIGRVLSQKGWKPHIFIAKKASKMLLQHGLVKNLLSWVNLSIENLSSEKQNKTREMMAVEKFKTKVGKRVKMSEERRVEFLASSGWK
jgi:hypothetical protein